MTQTYRTDDSGRWGTGKGSDLTPGEVDINFWDIVQRLTTQEARPDPSAGIDHFSVTGTNLYVHMTDSTVLGPYTLPTAFFHATGTWQPSTSYSLLDTFDINGGLYVVTYPHVSALTFSAGANDGLGHDYYSLLIQTPGSSLPTGGATAQVLQKSSGTNYAVTWGYKLPIDGNTRQVLLKASNTNQDAEWGDLDASDISFTPVTGSGISSTNVAAALEELSTSISSGGVALSELSDVQFATSSDPTEGALLMYDGSAWTAAGEGATSGQLLRWSGTTWEPYTLSNTITDVMQYVIDGGGSTITTGSKGYLHIPFGCTITQAVLLGDQTGSIVVDLYRTPYSSFDSGSTHPVSGDKITASAPPTISSANKSRDNTLTGWSTTLFAEDILEVHVTSVTSMQRVTISLRVTR